MNNTENVRASLHNFVDDYLDEREQLKTTNVISVAEREQLNKLLKWEIPNNQQDIKDVMKKMYDNIYSYSTKLHHTRYLGFVPGPACLESWVGDVMTNAYNLHAASWNSTSAASFIESKLIQFLGEQAGFDKNECGGIFVSGGSMANLTAVVTARNHLIQDNDISRATAYVSKEGHSSLKKALMIAGISHQNIKIVPTKQDDTMDIECLDDMVKEDIQSNLKPFLIIGSAGTTNTGSIDDFEQMGNIAEKYKLWMHVDGAYGATLLLSDYKYLLKGIERADSISWDGHKWLYQTYGCGMLLVKHKYALVETYNVHPDYLRDLENGSHEINYMDYGIELTRPARALKLWFTLQVYGLEKINQNIVYSIELAKYFEENLKRYNQWEIVSSASLAILCFRFTDQDRSLEENNRLNEEISKHALEENYAGIFTSKVNDKVVLRVCMINPNTTKEEVDTIINRLNQIVEKIKRRNEI